jgi:hypothetical protein
MPCHHLYAPTVVSQSTPRLLGLDLAISLNGLDVLVRIERVHCALVKGDPIRTVSRRLAKQ